MARRPAAFRVTAQSLPPRPAQVCWRLLLAAALACAERVWPRTGVQAESVPAVLDYRTGLFARTVWRRLLDLWRLPDIPGSGPPPGRPAPGRPVR